MCSRKYTWLSLPGVLRGMLEDKLQKANSSELVGVELGDGEGDMEAPRLTSGVYLDLVDAVH